MNNRYEIIPGFYISKTESMHDNYENGICRIQTIINCDNDLNFIVDTTSGDTICLGIVLYY